VRWKHLLDPGQDEREQGDAETFQQSLVAVWIASAGRRRNKTKEREAEPDSFYLNLTRSSA